MENIKQIIEQLQLEKNIKMEDIPSIDLYVDQVLQLFENTFRDSTRNKDEKVLTKTMINNYAKGKVFLPIKNKKYSREHIMLLSLIYQLKGSLSINDIKKALSEINEKLIGEENFCLGDFYQTYLQMEQQNVQDFQQDIYRRIEEVNEIPQDEQEQTFEKLLLLISFASMSNMYRRLAERIIDEM